MEQENLNRGTPPPETAAVPEVQPSTPEAKKEPQKPPKKELSMAERQKRKKMLIMPLFFLIFGGVMWLIFAPSDNDDKNIIGQSGFNAELPIPKDEGIVGDKRDAYEREAMQQKEQERMRSLQDFSTMFDRNEEQKPEESKQPEYYENPSVRQSKPVNNLQASANAYQDINKQLGEWYEEPAGKSAQELAVEERMNELERKLEEAEARKAAEDEQTALLEKSYAMAARYMPPQTGHDENSNAAPSTKDKVNVQPVKQVRHNVVSLLAAPMSDDEFIESFSQPRNMGFFTAAGNEGVKDKNSIRACVNQTVTLTSGREVQIRLLEPMQAGNILIPANSLITGSCKIAGERLDIAINSIQYAGNIIPVEISVYDTDGQRGIFIPNSDEVKAVKEVASTLASSAGTSIMISDDAGSQLAADMGKGLIQGASQYVSKKMSVVKVTLKANHRLLLLPKEN
ncbi:conjugative transposon protein TraM [Parabacteroides sp. PF5-9]|uniref:conjugative transposon protein TraM n=1 Tax=Parabacteroides sp. PF5-9 TaxID=1742404 RepID=UPI002476CD98|nr:conjugative transposon protein TraM [Parabacteroides sp. PF5-9]MDH6357045.1 conjugative transposon TraM protein [Parabacteroides sp. PF5-9]